MSTARRSLLFARLPLVLTAFAAIALLLFGLTYANAVFGQDEDTAERVNELLKQSTACF